MNIPLTPYRCQSWRLISSRYPPVHVFEDIASPEDFGALIALEARTNDRLRHESGALSLVPPEECVFGPGAGYIMAAFTHLSPEGSRFSDGSYGVYYAGKTLKTAIEETRHHRILFMRRTREKPQEIDMRVLTARVEARLHDITGKKKALPVLYHPDDYGPAQGWAKPLKMKGSHGIAYDSLRHPGGECFAVFRPKTLSKCTQAQHLRYFWDGETIGNVAELKRVG